MRRSVLPGKETKYARVYLALEDHQLYHPTTIVALEENQAILVGYFKKHWEEKGIEVSPGFTELSNAYDR